MKFKNTPRLEKGEAMSLAEMITNLLAIGLVALLYFMFVGKYFDIQTIVNSNEIERHVINAAQILLSSKKLIYSDIVGNEERYHRAIFEKAKLGNIETSGIESEITYPSSIIILKIKNLENGEEWSFDATDYDFPGSSEFVDCIKGELENDLSSATEFCWSMTTSRNIQLFEKSFPVLIEDDGLLYTGRLAILIAEEDVKLVDKES